MLTIERKENEAVTITHNNESMDIIVHNISHDTVKISFHGPLSFAVIRDNAKKDAEGKYRDV
jgi:sRNA-binding carbon storage regulator CsrA